MARRVKMNLPSGHCNWVPAGLSPTRPDHSVSSLKPVTEKCLLVRIWREDWFQVTVGVSFATTRFRATP